MRETSNAIHPVMLSSEQQNFAILTILKSNPQEMLGKMFTNVQGFIEFFL